MQIFFRWVEFSNGTESLVALAKYTVPSTNVTTMVSDAGPDNSTKLTDLLESRNNVAKSAVVTAGIS